MKEYTILACGAVIVAVLFDRISGVGVLKRGEFYFFLFVIFIFKLLVNGYLTGAGIVLYRPQFFLGWHIGSIPAEDFGFGFSMVTLTIIFWEYFKNKLTVKR